MQLVGRGMAICCAAMIICCLPSGCGGDHLSAEDGVPEGIIWYGVLKDGLAEAERTGKPILLTSAAPQCVGVSGIW